MHMRWLLGFGLSLLGHALLAALVTWGPTLSARQSPPPPAPVMVSFEVSAPESAEPPPPKEPPQPRRVRPDERRPVQRRAAARTPGRSRRPTRAVAEVAAVPQPPAERAAEPVTPSPAPRSAAPVVPDLSPRRAALSLLEQPGGDAAAPTVDGLAARLDADLSRDTASISSERPPPRLRHTLDGRYHYAGTGFDAVIEPDGRVQFADSYGDVALALPIVSARFDLTELAELAAGNDPHRAERRWFMEQTEALRLRLERQHWKQAKRLADARLRRALHDIWTRPDLPQLERRLRMFERWDECSNDERGDEGRRTVEAFIRERCSKGTPLAYTEDELRRLNRNRRSRAVFAPYAAPDGGAPDGGVPGT